MSETTNAITLDLQEPLAAVCGVDDRHLRILGEALKVTIQGRGNTLSVTGDAVDVAVTIDTLHQLYDLARGGQALYPADIRRSAEIVASGTRLEEVLGHVVPTRIVALAVPGTAIAGV